MTFTADETGHQFTEITGAQETTSGEERSGTEPHGAYFADGDHPFRAMTIAAFRHDDRSEATHGVRVVVQSLV